MRNGQYFFFMLLLFLAGCKKATVGELMDIDRDFSVRSTEVGMKQAFLDFAGDTAVLLQKNSLPVVGRSAILKSFGEFEDTGFVLTWEPLSGDISCSGDLGYTYGLYTLVRKSDGNSSRGKYVTIWKKQEDGSWKFVLDAGNEGL